MTEKNKGSVHNGVRLPVVFGSYAGEAGVTIRPVGVQIAFFGKARDFSAGMLGGIDGVPYSVDAVEPSAVVKGMVLLTVTAVTEPTAE